MRALLWFAKDFDTAAYVAVPVHRLESVCDDRDNCDRDIAIATLATPRHTTMLLFVVLDLVWQRWPVRTSTVSQSRAPRKLK